jgi:hypothetical protein
MYLLDKFSLLILLLASSAEAYRTVPMSPTQTNPPPLCVNCKHFIPYDLFCGSHRAEYGNCRLFYNVDVVTGEKSYEFASIARSTKTMCGTNATYFENRYKK